MDADQHPLFARFKANPPARAEMVDDFARRIGFDLPADYRAFLKQSNGGEGFFGQNNYLALWRVTDVPDLNQTYEVARAAPGLVVFGSNGGGEAIAFDTRSHPAPVVAVPFIVMDLNAIIYRAESFTAFLDILPKS